jgi:hypothetical protein
VFVITIVLVTETQHITELYERGIFRDTVSDGWNKVVLVFSRWKVDTKGRFSEKGIHL